MKLAEHLNRLAKMVPGVAGYQTMEDLRETDRMIRERLALDLREGERDMERVKRRLIEKKDLSLLPGLDYLTAKMDKLSNVMRYASQGYRGFDPYPVDRENWNSFTHSISIYLMKSKPSRSRSEHWRRSPMTLGAEGGDSDPG